MKNIILIIALFSLIAVLNALPSCYHTYAEINAELQQLETQYPNIAKVYTIGYSELENIPIYALKISDNVLLEEFEPAVLFVGQVHAEEVLGVETTMSNMNEILANSQTTPYGNWIAQLEIWFIPTLNPEGHNVVSSFLDSTYRKNKRDTNNNNIFDYSPLVGYDIDGVDINRNFAFNWCHGDTLLQPANYEQYDYYRGEAPMSESEVQGFATFARAQKPVFAIVWHSARNVDGGLSEKVFYPLNWQDVRPAPDLSLGQQIGVGVAGQINGINGNNYLASAAEGRKGGINDWLYQQFGTICLVIECGLAPNIQPDSSDMVSILAQTTKGTKWMLNRALPSSAIMPSNSMLRGRITDAVTSQPLEAEIIVEQRHAPWFAPRKSDPISGWYFRPVITGRYTIRFRKKGYTDHVVTNFDVNGGSWTPLDAQLQPIPPTTISGTVRSTLSNQLLPAKIVLYDIENDTLQTNGEFVLTSYQGRHRLEITSEGYYPYVDTLIINQGIQHLNLNYVLTPATTHFSEDWENGTGLWLRNGPWTTQNQLSMSGFALTDSWGDWGFYAQDCNVWIRTQNPIAIPQSGNPLLIFDQHLYTEFVYDVVRVEVSADTLNWQTIYSNSGQYDWWHPVYISLNQFTGQNVYLRFRLTDQSIHKDLTDPGWTIDNIRIVTGSATSNLEEFEGVTPVTVLYPNYPNPFNPETTIKFSLSTDSKVSIDIYNLKGQKVKTLARQLYSRGTHSLVWNGTDENSIPVGSGIYFYRMHSGNRIQTQKMILLK